MYNAMQVNSYFYKKKKSINQSWAAFIFLFFFYIVLRTCTAFHYTAKQTPADPNKWPSHQLTSAAVFLTSRVKSESVVQAHSDTHTHTGLQPWGPDDLRLDA